MRLAAPVRWRLVTCYTISAAIAGIAGGLWAQSNAYVNLSTLGLDRAATVLIILVLGGYGRIYGAFIVPSPTWRYRISSPRLIRLPGSLGLGLLLVVIALFARNGMIGLWDQLTRRFSRSVPHHEHSAARNPRSQYQFRRARCYTRRQPQARRRGAPCPDWPQRRRQDHADQPVDRRAQPTAGQVLFKGNDITAVALADRVKLGSHALSRSTGCSAGSLCSTTSTSRSPSGLGAAPTMLRPAGVRKDVVEEAMALTRNTLRLTDDANHRIAELPYGRQRLVELAITLGPQARRAAPSTSPRRCAVDREPHILDASRRCRARSACSSCDHDMDLVFRFAERITVLVGGAVFAEGTPKEIAANPGVRAVYLGQAGHG